MREFNLALLGKCYWMGFVRSSYGMSVGRWFDDNLRRIVGEIGLTFSSGLVSGWVVSR